MGGSGSVCRHCSPCHALTKNNRCPWSFSLIKTCDSSSAHSPCSKIIAAQWQIISISRTKPSLETLLLSSTWIAGMSYQTAYRAITQISKLLLVWTYLNPVSTELASKTSYTMVWVLTLLNQCYQRALRGSYVEWSSITWKKCFFPTRFNRT